MAAIKKQYIIPVGFICVAAIVSHFLPNFIKPKKETKLLPETQDWKK
jgi:hypothetical protein